MDTENTAGAEVQEQPAAAPDAQAQETAGGTILGGAEGAAPEAQTQEQPAEAPESYDFTGIIPEGMEYDEESAQAFGAIAKECNLTQDQAAKIAAYGMQYMQNGVQLAEAQRQQTIAGWGDNAKKELGAQFEQTTALAARGILALETKVPGIKAMLNETGAGNRVEMIRLLAEIGNLTGEDAGHLGGTAGTVTANVYNKTNFKKYM